MNSISNYGLIKLRLKKYLKNTFSIEVKDSPTCLILRSCLFFVKSSKIMENLSVLGGTRNSKSSLPANSNSTPGMWALNTFRRKSMSAPS